MTILNQTAKVSYDRYTEFLNNVGDMRVVYRHDSSDQILRQTELLESEKAKTDPSTAIALAECNKDAIGFSDCSFSWDSFEQTEASARHTRKAFRLRFDGEVLFERGKINIIVGPTASGKVREPFQYY